MDAGGRAAQEAKAEGWGEGPGSRAFSTFRTLVRTA